MREPTKMRRNIRRRLVYIERELQRGRVPILRKALPGAVELYEKYGQKAPFLPHFYGERETEKKARRRARNQRYLRTR